MKSLIAIALGAVTICTSVGQTKSSSTLPDTNSSDTSVEYKAVQKRLARGWNTWDVHSVTTQVLLPAGLAIHLSMEHKTTESGDALLRDTLIGRLAKGSEQVFPGPHSWDGSYTDLSVSWKDHNWRVQTAHDGPDLVFLVSPTPSGSKASLPPTAVFHVDYLWNSAGSVSRQPGRITASSASGETRIFCTCEQTETSSAALTTDLAIGSPYFAVDLDRPVAVSTGKPRSFSEVQTILERAHHAYLASLPTSGATHPVADAIQTTLGWDTIYEPTKQRVISPVSRIWSVDWGGYVLFDWDSFFASTMAAIGDRDLAYADTIETLRESTDQGFVPNYARGGNWKSFDRSEPPVGAITVLGLYQKYNDLWFLNDTFPALLQWNRWWDKHRNLNGYLVWGSNGGNLPGNLDDGSKGTLRGAILESGLDNSPMYDGTTFDRSNGLMEFADVGLMSMYIADSAALAQIADALKRPTEASELRERGKRYAKKLQTLWSPETGIFLNKDLRTGEFSKRLSPTNFYPMLARVASPEQAQEMIQKHLLNPGEFWGKWIIPSISLDDPAFKDQDYWRGRIWGPMNYLVYLGLERYDVPEVRKQFAEKSANLFLNEWRDKGHVHENYNAILGSGDDVLSSDRFYHWGALLGYIEYLEQTRPSEPGPKAP